jgi:hypothetical protein
MNARETRMSKPEPLSPLTLKRRIIGLFLGLYFFHILHVLEEIWGEFRAMRILGHNVFIAGNAFLLAIPLVVFFYVLDDRRWALRLGQIYCIIMSLNGFGHGMAVLLTGRYFGYYAGAISGIGLIALSIPLALSLEKSLKRGQVLTFNKVSD